MKKPRILKSWSRHNVPLQIWNNILSRLPVKSVLRFRRVCKPWKSLIDDPEFCRLHLINFKNNRDETHLFAVQKTNGKNVEIKREKMCVVRSCKIFKKITANFGPLDTVKLGGRCVVVNSVDGLVMVRYGLKSKPAPELVLWNPSIGRTRILPQSPAISEHLWHIDLGIGFCPLINDYKHVRLVLRGSHTLVSVSVYTVGTGLWKSVEFKGREISDWRWTYDFNSKWRVVCFKGAIYFTASYPISGNEKKWDLVSFDLNDEVFAFTALPPDKCAYDTDESDSDSDDDDDVNRSYEKALKSLPKKKKKKKKALKVVTLLDGGCSLGVIYLLPTSGCIFAMESCGDWVKRYSFMATIQEIFQEGRDRPEFLCLNKNGVMYFRWHPLQLTSYNLETEDEENLVEKFPRPSMHEVCIYKESLVLLNG